MAGPGTPDANLQAENLRLAEQVRVFSGDEHIRREAAPWLDATPAERVAKTWRLCALVPWFRSLWPEDVRARRRARAAAGEHAGDSRAAQAVGGRQVTTPEAGPTEVAKRLADRFLPPNRSDSFV